MSPKNSSSKCDMSNRSPEDVSAQRLEWSPCWVALARRLTYNCLKGKKLPYGEELIGQNRVLVDEQGVPPAVHGRIE
jgi:hypothetical protein